ncbi:hypothetical protein Arnit_2320 [Arcobacter nitrofigilis DSM 7299]|uniref:Outer membrane lipoprotein carrier protein LolA n=1 Tax=Arcobacter nitrofigilis (strain ATCC 33309 / DSM 7299 / CCUG 15893 / LMG 7604 / NCTC 12251 / CI) TaxID=572480 RepID=D5V109_ARCNC|nr:hypothetical protein [Arcobacter nitrofigilis]ADG93971.1 hypothetical protein Arnit_2320 [Arcobacter nitrofigilis DSM 7299]
MFKVLFLFLFSTLFLFSNEIEFKEEKYISALNASVYRNGILNINNDFIKVAYPQQNKSFTFTKENIIEKDGKKENIITYEDNLDLTIFSKVIESIYTNKIENIKEYFQIKKSDGYTTLIPSEYVANVIKRIEYKKIDSKLKFLKIYFTNDDWINIVQTN